jgi:trehalose 6-phosphate synthase
VSRLVNVSNRVSVPRKGVAPGGLAVGVLAAMRSRGGLWFGWSGETGENGSTVQPTVTRRGDITFATIDLPAAEHELYYGGFCNSTLWPLFHYFLDTFRFRDDQYDAYHRVNHRFAQALVPLLAPDDVVWVHDYHLFPFAQALRERGVTQPIGFFLHIPFPHIEAFRALPVHLELMETLLAYDLVGVQTRRDADSLRSAAVELWGAGAVARDGSLVHGARRVAVDVFPIGVDVERTQHDAVATQSHETVCRLVDGLRGRRCVLGVDRLDYSKGLVERFLAYEQFLTDHPHNLGRITYLQIAPLSRAELRTYAGIRRELEQAAGRTNGRFADTDWTPIRYLNRNFPHAELMGFMRNAAIGLVTPVRDGMNLVAKEFIAAQDPDDPGVLVLSGLTGAALELTDALLVNPNDIRGVADAIEAGLTMPRQERCERHRRMLETLRRNDIHAWHSRFLQRLEEAAQRRQRLASGAVA